eukprot:Pgem_evm2s4672
MTLLYTFISWQNDFENDRKIVKSMMESINYKDYLVVKADPTLFRSYVVNWDNNTLILQCGDYYEDLPSKINRLMQFFVEIADKKKFTHIAKFDSDISLTKHAPEKYYIKEDYLGGLVSPALELRIEHSYHLGKCSANSPWNTKTYTGPVSRYVMGNGYILSLKAANIVGNSVLSKAIIPKMIYEDVYVGLVLRFDGILPVEKRKLLPFEYEPICRRFE